MISLIVAATAFAAPSLLLEGGLVYDGLGGAPRKSDIRIAGDRIVALGNLEPMPGETVLQIAGLAISPGFIDSHSHADRGRKPETQIPQGITTAICGQDGGWSGPVAKRLGELDKNPLPYNVAFLSGHGGIREAVMGKSQERPPTARELYRMKDLVRSDMKSGAFGLSSGLEYEPGKFAGTSELVALASEIRAFGGIYQSHVRDEAGGALESFREVVRIAREAKVRAQITHIKLGVASVQGKAAEALAIILEARRRGLQVSADVYPYTFWQATVRVLTPLPFTGAGSKALWQSAIADVGGPQNVRISRFTPDKSWEGRTLAELAARTGKDPPDLVMEIIRRTAGEEDESVIVTAMLEADVRRFLASPLVMISSDGSNGSSHPRGAGAYPKVLGRYVREQGLLSLQQAIRKMTWLPARTFGIKDRGVIRPGAFADLVVFDTSAIRDTSTPDRPSSPPLGAVHVLVNGRFAMRDGRVTGQKPGKGLRSGGLAPPVRPSARRSPSWPRSPPIPTRW